MEHRRKKRVERREKLLLNYWKEVGVEMRTSILFLLLPLSLSLSFYLFQHREGGNQFRICRIDLDIFHCPLSHFLSAESCAFFRGEIFAALW